MEENYDEQLLLSQRVNINSEQSIISQVLRIVVFNEFKAYETYTKIIERFGPLEPFVDIKESEAKHYSALIALLEKYGIEVPINNCLMKIEIPNSYIECCELSVAAEIKNIAMYDNLLLHIKEEDIRDILFRLQAVSFNNHLPIFRSCVINYYTTSNNQEFNQEDLIQKFAEYQGLFDDLMTGNVDQNKLTELFSKLNISMISGGALGSASVALLNSYLNKENKE